MSGSSEDLIGYMPLPGPDLHRSIMAQIARETSGEETSTFQVLNAQDPPDYIARIEKASRVLQAAALRASKFEQENYELKKQQKETAAQLTQAKDRSTRLEQELAVEREKMIHAHTLAFAASKRANCLEQELKTAKAKYAELTASIDRQFAYLIETTVGLKAA